jgi:hypothetical protein
LTIDDFVQLDLPSAPLTKTRLPSCATNAMYFEQQTMRDVQTALLAEKPY